MIIFPAIDLKDGQVVRLHQGRFDEVKVYSNDPVAFALQWQEAGAQWLHVVDLDGAKTGVMKNIEWINKITQAVSIPVQMGGGIREVKDIDRLIQAKVARVVLGTKAIQNHTFLKEILDRWSHQIVVSLDCSKGYVALSGWQEVSTLKAEVVARELKSLGLRMIVYTDISRDGTLTGPNLERLQFMLKETQMPIIASGGVSNLGDLQALKPLEKDGLVGVITGKALYEGRLDLKEALSLC